MSNQIEAINAPQEAVTNNYIDIFDNENPASLVNKIDKNSLLYDNLIALPEEIKDMSLEEIKEVLNPTKLMQILRHSFWTEANLAYRFNRKIDLGNVVGNICTVRRFRQLMSPMFAAYLAVPVTNYETQLIFQHYRAFEEVNAILDMDEKTKDGRSNIAILRLKFEIFKFLDERVNGGVVQKTLNIHANVNKPEPPYKVKGKSQETIIAELEKELRGEAVLSRDIQAEDIEDIEFD